MKKSKKSLKKKLDTVWGTKGKDKAQCEICATLPMDKRINYTQLHPHHIIGRTFMATRFDLRNRLWSCPYHHTMGPSGDTVQFNQGGWFLNWESDNDWMGKHRAKDKEYLRGQYNKIRIWTVEELEELLNKLKE